jgi:hypothetical protein
MKTTGVRSVAFASSICSAVVETDMVPSMIKTAAGLLLPVTSTTGRLGGVSVKDACRKYG